MTKTFVSYHFVAKDGSNHGFGNYMGEFDPEAYKKKPEKFVLDLQKTLEKQLEEKLDKKVAVKILFWK